MTKLQKIILIAAAILTLVVVGLGVVWAMKGETKAAAEDIPTAYYTVSAQVCDADTSTDIVTFEDGAGNLWEAEGTGEWNVGENAELLMHNHGTEKVTDDEIIGIARGKWYMEHN